MTSSICWVDIETRSACDLRENGLYNYAVDPSTRLLCISYAIDDGEVKLWRPGEPKKLLAPFLKHTGEYRAHNAAFERVVLNALGVLDLPVARWLCTSAQARANNMPGSLEDIGRFIGSGMRKDHRGAFLIRKLCVPNKNGEFCDDGLLLAELYEYCRQDVRAMREVSKAIRQLTASEREDYWINERINDRGILVDTALADAAVRYSAEEQKELTRIVEVLTAGEIKTVRSPKMREWVYARVGPDARKVMTALGKTSLDKSVRQNLLQLAEDNPDEISPTVKELLQCVEDISASSVAKFARAAALASRRDGRIRGAFVFSGGSATGRYSSYGLQLHNFSRAVAADPESVRDAMVQGNPIAPHYGPSVASVLRSMLRPVLRAAEGDKYVVADWASIEARITPWVANSPAGVKKLEMFTGGVDIYKVNAASAFNVPYGTITKEQRQIGKVMELACGFAGGVGAFQTMGHAYGVVLSEDRSQVMVNAWRDVNRWAQPYWSQLERAYNAAYRNPGHEFSVGRVAYLYDATHLWCALPSGRLLCYPFLRADNDGLSYAKATWKPAADAAEWPRARLWRGLVCENITQAIAADLLRAALKKLDHVVLHCHDEIVLEVSESDTTLALGRLTDVMVNDLPDWAKGLPMSVEGSVMSRYGK